MKNKNGPSKHKRTEDYTRRDFLRKTSIGGGCAAAAAVWGYAAYSDNPVYHKPEKIHTLKNFRLERNLDFQGIAIVRGKDAERMVEAAIGRFGGIEKFVQPGDMVVIKPNVGWDRTPEQAANTNPDVVAAVVRQCVKARAGRIVVTDVSCNDAYRCFSRSGIEKATLSAGGEVLFPREDMFLSTDLKGEILNTWPVLSPFLEADKLINIPVVKQHSLSKCTLAMKNWYGVLGGRRNQLHQNINASIADLASAMKPTLSVIDATRVLMRNGPTGGNVSDVKSLNTIVVGLDELALDTLATGFLGLKPEEVPFLEVARQRGVGTTDLQSLAIEEIKIF